MRTEILVGRRMRRWSPNMIVCKGVIEVGENIKRGKYIRRLLDLACQFPR